MCISDLLLILSPTNVASEVDMFVDCKQYAEEFFFTTILKCCFGKAPLTDENIEFLAAPRSKQNMGE